MSLLTACGFVVLSSPEESGTERNERIFRAFDESGSYLPTASQVPSLGNVLACAEFGTGDSWQCLHRKLERPAATNATMQPNKQITDSSKCRPGHIANHLGDVCRLRPGQHTFHT